MTTNSHEVWANSNTPLFLANPALSITLSPQSTGGNVVLTNSNGTFLVNGQPTGDVSKWSLYPAISNTIKMDSSGNNITNIGNNLYFNGSLIANASDIQDIGDWSLYNAVSDVNLSNLTSNYSIVGAKNITAISNITGGSMNTGSLTSSGNVSGTIGTFTTTLISPSLSNTGNVAVTCTSNLTLSATSNLYSTSATISNAFNSQYTIAGNRGSDYSDFCYTNLSNKGGKGGSINLTADAGSVDIGGTTYGVGGQINLTANSPLTLPYNLTSAIKMSAASVLSYAGAVTPLGSLAGYNYIQGTLGVNIVAGSASSLPNTAGTNYLWGLNGTKIQNTLYVDNIVNYPSSNLNIHPDSGQAVDMTRVQFIGMGSASNENLAYPVIRGSGNASLYGFSSVSATQGNLGSVLGCSNINNSSIGDGFGLTDLTLTAYKQTNITLPVTYTYRNINLTSSSNINLNTANGGQVFVNGSAIDAVGQWSTYPATQDVDFSNHYLTNVAGIDSITFSNLVETPMLKNLDASNYSISNVADLTGNSNFNIRKNTIDPLYIRNVGAGGQIILVAGSNAAFGSFGQSNLDIYHNSNAVTIQGTPNIVMKSPISMSNNAISNVPTISNSAGTLTLQGTSVIMPCTLNMSNNAISNVSTINGGTILTNPLTTTLNMSNNGISNVSTITGSTITITPTYPLVLNQALDMTAHNISNVAGILSSSSITISPTTSLYVTKPLDMGANGITNCTSLTSLTGLALQSGGTISMNQTLDMINHGISNVGALNGVATLNGRTPFSTPAPLSLDMASNVISNVAGIYANTGVLYGQGLTLSNNGGYVNTIAQGGAMITANTGITLTAGTSTPPTPIGASNIQAYAPLTMYLQAGALNGGVPYHSITMSQSSPMYIGSSNAISLNATSNIYLNSDTYRSLSGTPVYQGTQQYGTFSNLGTGGSFSVTFNYPYSASYYITLTNTTSNTALQYSAVKTSLSNFTLYYGAGSAISTTYIDWVATGK